MNANVRQVSTENELYRKHITKLISNNIQRIQFDFVYLFLEHLNFHSAHVKFNHFIDIKSKRI